MSEVNYTTMSDEALRKYFLAHKNDQSVLQVYLARRHEQSRQVITKVGDPDFDVKIAKAIQEKLQSFNPS